jgi:hypothetical protein
MIAFVFSCAIETGKAGVRPISTGRVHDNCSGLFAVSTRDLRRLARYTSVRQALATSSTA